MIPDGVTHMVGNTADELSVVAGAGARAIDLRPHRSDPRIAAARVGSRAEQDDTSDHGEPEHHAAHANLPFILVSSGSSGQCRNAPLGEAQYVVPSAASRPSAVDCPSVPSNALRQVGQFVSFAVNALNLLTAALSHASSSKDTPFSACAASLLWHLDTVPTSSASCFVVRFWHFSASLLADTNPESSPPNGVPDVCPSRWPRSQPCRAGSPRCRR